MTSLRRLAACTACGRQYDASGHEPGARFHCACGELVKVSPEAGRDAAVVRCSSCGAARSEGTLSCHFCSADFTLHEQDLHTLCPICVTRVSDRAKFCHSCGSAIAPQGGAGERAEETCPACEGGRRLYSRSVDEEGVTVLECDRCAGVWVGHRIFEILEKRAQAQMASWGQETERKEPRAQSGKFYRSCVECGKLMHRRNYGRRSGMIVDVCHQHGIWFDQGELEDILDWVRSGGPLRVRQLDEIAGRSSEAKGPVAVSPIDVLTTGSGSQGAGGSYGRVSTFGELLLDAIADFFLVAK